MQELTRDGVTAIITSDEPGFLYLYTPLCGTCQLAEKMLSVTAELLPSLRKGKIDLNFMPEIAESWEIESVPCLLIFQNGRLKDKIYAFQSVPYLLEAIQKGINNEPGQAEQLKNDTQSLQKK